MRVGILDTARSQIIAILVSCSVATFALIAVLLVLLRPTAPPPPHGPWPGAAQAAAIIKAIHAVPVEDRQKIGAAVSTPEMRVHIGTALPCVEAPPGIKTRDLQLLLGEILADRIGELSIRHCLDAADTEEISQVDVPSDGVSLRVSSHEQKDFRFFFHEGMPLIVVVSFLLIVVIALSVWTLWWINRPLRRLATNVETFGLDGVAAPLHEQRPREIRQLAQAFNRMQGRIARSIEERTRMLMAVGHDLRTPLTRLKLRVEMDKTLTGRQDLLRDLHLMQKMINGALAFLNDQGDHEAYETVDLGVLVESICVEFAECRKDVTYIGAYGLDCRCQPTAVTRAVGNLIENGCKYGTQVVVDVRRSDGQALVEIRDNGPGIPNAMRETALLPFARLDPARAVAGSLGLGLSIVQEIVRRHRGQLLLLDAAPQGLLVRIVLPLSDMAEGAQPEQIEL